MQILLADQEAGQTQGELLQDLEQGREIVMVSGSGQRSQHGGAVFGCTPALT